MFRPLLAAALTLPALFAPAHAADVNVGVSIDVGQPGFYGRINIGNMPPPVLRSRCQARRFGSNQYFDMVLMPSTISPTSPASSISLARR